MRDDAVTVCVVCDPRPWVANHTYPAGFSRAPFFMAWNSSVSERIMVIRTLAKKKKKKNKSLYRRNLQ